MISEELQNYEEGIARQAKFKKRVIKKSDIEYDHDPSTVYKGEMPWTGFESIKRYVVGDPDSESQAKLDTIKAENKNLWDWLNTIKRRLNRPDSIGGDDLDEHLDLHDQNVDWYNALLDDIEDLSDEYRNQVNRLKTMNMEMNKMDK